MARANWNRFHHGSLPTNFNYEDNADYAFATPGSSNLLVEGYGMNINDMWGFQINTGTMENGSVSVALRAPSGQFTNLARFTGMFLRMQHGVTDGEIITGANRQYYAAGIFADNTNAGVNMRCYRVSDSAQFQQGAQWFCPVLSTQWVQWEIQTTTVGGTVVLSRRHNAGSTVSYPGSAGWTSWTSITTDVSPGVLINPGYCGIISHCATSWSSGASQYQYWDYFRAVEGIQF